MREPAEVTGRFLRRLADNGQVQAAADHAGDVSERHALFGDAVVPRSRGTLLKHEPVETRRVEPVHGWPAVEPVAHIRRGSLLAHETDEQRNETMIALAVELALNFEKSWMKAVGITPCASAAPLRRSARNAIACVNERASTAFVARCSAPQAIVRSRPSFEFY